MLTLLISAAFVSASGISVAGETTSILQGPIIMPPTIGRPTDAVIKSQAPIVAAKVRGANAARVVRVAKTTETNRSVERRVEDAPKGVSSKSKADPKLPEVTDYVRRFVGRVRIQVVNELGAPVPNLAVRGRPAPQNSVTDKEGWVEFDNVPLPAAISMDLDPKEKEFDLDGEQGKGILSSVLIPTEIEAILKEDSGPAGIARIKDEHPEYALRQLRPTHDSRVRKGIEVRDGARVTVFEETWSHVIEVTSSQRVTVRRTVADFALPKDVGIQKLRNVKPAVYLGERRLPLADSGDSWRFRADRDMLGEEEATIVVQYDADGVGYGGEVRLRELDKAYYAPVTPLSRPSVGLESIGEGAILLAGKPVSESSPLSPLYWFTGLDSGSSGINLNLGRDLQKLLNVPQLPKPNIPNPSRDKYRYGMWYTVPDLGLAIRTRCDNPEFKDRVLPSERDGGLIEAIRVIGGDGKKNSVAGVLRIGAERHAVLEAFGSPDTMSPDALKELFGSRDKARAVFGDSRKYEYWDETFMYGGIRVKWNAGKVKWYEIARPIPLLYNGTKAFVPPDPVSVSFDVKATRGTEDSLAQPVMRVLRRAFEKAAGVTKPKSSPADWNASADVQVSQTRSPAQRTERVKVGKDQRGRDRYEDRTVHYTKLQVAVRVTFRAKDRAGNEKSDSWTLTNSGDEATTSVSNLLEWIIGDQRGATEISQTLSREAGRFFTGLSNVTGTVLAVNAQDGKLLINLGSSHGVQPGGAMDFELFLCHKVNPKTGRADSGAMVKLIGEDVGKAWLEAIKVGEDWCIAQPKERKPGPLGVGAQTGIAYSVIPRLIDPGSGVLRVRIAPRRSDR